MRTNSDIFLFDGSADFVLDDVSDGDLVGYARPAQVLDDPALSASRKRELLAFWASDIHAVAGSPALRSLATGVTVGIDEIMAALHRLDDEVDFGAFAPAAGTAATVS